MDEARMKELLQELHDIADRNDWDLIILLESDGQFTRAWTGNGTTHIGMLLLARDEIAIHVLNSRLEQAKTQEELTP